MVSWIKACPRESSMDSPEASICSACLGRKVRAKAQQRAAEASKSDCNNVSVSCTMGGQELLGRARSDGVFSKLGNGPPYIIAPRIPSRRHLTSPSSFWPLHPSSFVFAVSEAIIPSM